MKLKTLSRPSHSNNTLPGTPALLCFAISCIIVFSLALAGCSNDDANDSSPAAKNTIEQPHGTSDPVVTDPVNNDHVNNDDDELPDLYANLSDAPLTDSVNPVHLDGHNPFLPFPSDLYAYRDQTSPTGVRLKITNNQLPPDIRQILEKIPETLQMDAVFKDPDGSDADGFSIQNNVLFEFDREVDPTWVCDVDENMARDGGDTFYLMDLTTGEFIPALAMESHHAKDPNRTTRDTVMQVMARGRFEHGRRYMAFVTKNFKDKDGNDFSSSSGFEQAKSKDGSPISEFYEPWLAYLESEKSIHRDHILTATIFTTRSRASSIGPLVDMFKTVLEDEFTDTHVVIDNNVRFPFCSLGRIVCGRMNLRDFRDENGVINYTPGFKGTRDKVIEDWVPFLLFIPKDTFPKPYPVNIAGSGIVMTKEMMLPVACANASLGVATISIDWPSHGARIASEGWSVFKGVGFVPGGTVENGGDLPRLLSMFAQISVDIMSTYRALKTYFTVCGLDGIKDLDTDNLSYSGFSLGSLSGISASTCMPDLKGTFLSVAPVNFTKILSCGTFLLGGPSVTMPDGLPGSWYAITMTAIVSQVTDLFDGTHFADGYRNGIPEMGTGPRPLTATYARNDGWTTAESGVALMEIADLPLIYSQDDPTNLGELIDNFKGMGAENILAEYDNYAVAELTLFNNDFKINETIARLGIPDLVYRVLGYDWYDISGTLEHAGNALSPACFYFLTNFINNVQGNGNAEDFQAALNAFGELIE